MGVTFTVQKPPMLVFRLGVQGADDMTGRRKPPHYFPYRFSPDFIVVEVYVGGKWFALVTGGRRLSNGNVSTTTREGTSLTERTDLSEIPDWVREAVAQCQEMARGVFNG